MKLFLTLILLSLFTLVSCQNSSDSTSSSKSKDNGSQTQDPIIPDENPEKVEEVKLEYNITPIMVPHAVTDLTVDYRINGEVEDQFISELTNDLPITVTQKGGPGSLSFYLNELPDLKIVDMQMVGDEIEVSYQNIGGSKIIGSDEFVIEIFSPNSISSNNITYGLHSKFVVSQILRVPTDGEIHKLKFTTEEFNHVISYLRNDEVDDINMVATINAAGKIIESRMENNILEKPLVLANELTDGFFDVKGPYLENGYLKFRMENVGQSKIAAHSIKFYKQGNEQGSIIKNYKNNVPAGNISIVAIQPEELGLLLDNSEVLVLEIGQHTYNLPIKLNIENHIIADLELSGAKFNRMRNEIQFVVKNSGETFVNRSNISLVQGNDNIRSNGEFLYLAPGEKKTIKYRLNKYDYEKIGKDFNLAINIDYDNKIVEVNENNNTQNVAGSFAEIDLELLSVTQNKNLEKFEVKYRVNCSEKLDFRLLNVPFVFALSDHISYDAYLANDPFLTPPFVTLYTKLSFQSFNQDFTVSITGDDYYKMLNPVINQIPEFFANAKVEAPSYILDSNSENDMKSVSIGTEIGDDYKLELDNIVVDRDKVSFTITNIGTEQYGSEIYKHPLYFRLDLVRLTERVPQEGDLYNYEGYGYDRETVFNTTTYPYAVYLLPGEQKTYEIEIDNADLILGKLYEADIYVGYEAYQWMYAPEVKMVSNYIEHRFTLLPDEGEVIAELQLKKAEFGNFNVNLNSYENYFKLQIANPGDTDVENLKVKGYYLDEEGNEAGVAYYDFSLDAREEAIFYKPGSLPFKERVQYIFEIDPDNEIQEIDENNNMYKVYATKKHKVDLTLLDVVFEPEYQRIKILHKNAGLTNLYQGTIYINAEGYTYERKINLIHGQNSGIYYQYISLAELELTIEDVLSKEFTFLVEAGPYTSLSYQKYYEVDLSDNTLTKNF